MEFDKDKYYTLMNQLTSNRMDLANIEGKLKEYKLEQERLKYNILQKEKEIHEFVCEYEKACERNK